MEIWVLFPNLFGVNCFKNAPVCCKLLPLDRFGKSTHISMISNCVTHPRSYTNSVITKNYAQISPVAPRDRRRRRTER